MQSGAKRFYCATDQGDRTMAGDERDLGLVTRALLLGVAVGTLPLLLVGCEVTSSPTQAVNPALATDQELCARVLSSR